MQSLSGRKTESYFTDTNLIKTCKLLNLFRYHCNAPSLQAKLPSQLSAFGPGQIQRASLPPKKRALRTSTCVAMRFHLRRGGFPLIVIRGFPLFLILLLYLFLPSCIVAAPAPRAYEHTSIAKPSPESYPSSKAERAVEEGQCRACSVEGPLLPLLRPFLRNSTSCARKDTTDGHRHGCNRTRPHTQSLNQSPPILC